MLDRGSPAVLVVSTVFVELARGEARALGYEDVPMLVVPHPFGILPGEEVRRLGERLAHRLATMCAGAGP